MSQSFFFHLHRLSKYSNFSMTNKLQGMLGDLEDKVRQAGSQGSSREVSERLSQLSQKYSTAGELHSFVVSSLNCLVTFS